MDLGFPKTGRPRKIYVASSWRTSTHGFVVKTLREAGHKVFDYRYTIGMGKDTFIIRPYDEPSELMYRLIPEDHVTENLMELLKALDWRNADTL